MSERSVLECREDFRLSVITSWWQPPGGSLSGSATPSAQEPAAGPLPSVAASMEVGIPAIDYYFVGLGEEKAWETALALPGASPWSQGMYRLILDHPGGDAAAAALIRQAFRRTPQTSAVLRGHMAVVALATYAPAISQTQVVWMAGSRAIEPLMGIWWPDVAVSGAGACPHAPLLAALSCASASGAPVVEIVCGLRINAAPSTDGEGPHDGRERVMWADVLVPPVSPDPVTPLRLPEEILVENLFRIATFILTRLPPRETAEGSPLPPVTMGLEVEHGSVYIVNSPSAYKRVRDEYHRVVDEKMERLGHAIRGRDPGEFTMFSAFPDGLGPADLDRLGGLYRLCVGLNVDVGHMLLLGVEPWQISPVAWFDGFATWDAGRRGYREAGEDAAAMRCASEGLTFDIVHYHLSDHHSVHYADLPPGEHHGSADFEPWIRQAYALAQLSRPAYELQAPVVHPNFTQAMAIELEASALGVDRVVKAYARVGRWVRHCLRTDRPIGVIT